MVHYELAVALIIFSFCVQVLKFSGDTEFWIVFESDLCVVLFLLPWQVAYGMEVEHFLLHLFFVVPR